MDVLRDSQSFLAKLLPPSAEHTLKPKDPTTMSVKELKTAIRNNGLSSQAVGFNEKYEFVKLLVDYYASK
jgi:hypothetical protein